MAWRVAYSLDQLLAQLNALAPSRSRASDGSIGDAAHQAQGSASDHNPWYGPGIVTARDFTHDVAGGLDCSKLAAALVASRDPRVKYIIWQGRICDSRAQFNPWTWQPSSGHYQHLHLSVMPNASADDRRPWSLPGLAPAGEDDDFMTDVYEHVVTVNSKKYSVGSALHYLIAAEHARSGIPGDPDGKQPGDPFGTPLFTDNPGTPAAKVVRLRDFYHEIRERAIADVDEVALAAELVRLGLNDVSPAEVKAAVQAALREGTDAE